MAEPLPELSVIIVSWNVRKLLDECLCSVGIALKELNAETTVIDNASHDGSPQMVSQKYPAVHLIANKDNLGFGRANNQALRLCRGRYVLLLNPDTLVPGDTFKKMIAFMDTHPHAGLAGPEQRSGTGKINFSNLVHWSPRELVEYLFERIISLGRGQTRLLFSQPRQVPILNAGCWIIRQSALAETGLFDEQMFLYGEEYDMCERMRRAGWEIWFLRDVEIIHYRRQSIRQCSRLQDLRFYFQSMRTWLKKLYLEALDRWVRGHCPGSSMCWGCKK
jgi:GT2 family glycosyltransferase